MREQSINITLRRVWISQMVYNEEKRLLELIERKDKRLNISFGDFIKNIVYEACESQALVSRALLRRWQNNIDDKDELITQTMYLDRGAVDVPELGLINPNAVGLDTLTLELETAVSLSGARKLENSRKLIPDLMLELNKKEDKKRDTKIKIKIELKTQDITETAHLLRDTINDDLRRRLGGGNPRRHKQQH